MGDGRNVTIIKGPHLNRTGRVVNSWLFGLLLTVNVPARFDEGPVWLRDPRQRLLNGTPRAWVTVWRWQVRDIDERIARSLDAGHNLADIELGSMLGEAFECWRW